MKMKHLIMTGTLGTLMLTTPLFAAVPDTSRIEMALEKYRTAGGANFNAAAGEKLWKRDVLSSKDNKIHNCGSCHTNDLTQTGKHHKTKKPIKPMALSANSERYTKMKKIEKWFKRNCKWTWGRECTAQEKGDFLTYLINYK